MIQHMQNKIHLSEVNYLHSFYMDDLSKRWIWNPFRKNSTAWMYQRCLSNHVWLWNEYIRMMWTVSDSIKVRMVRSRHNHRRTRRRIIIPSEKIAPRHIYICSFVVYTSWLSIHHLIKKVDFWKNECIHKELIYIFIASTFLDQCLEEVILASLFLYLNEP